MVLSLIFNSSLITVSCIYIISIIFLIFIHYFSLISNLTNQKNTYIYIFLLNQEHSYDKIRKGINRYAMRRRIGM